MNRCAQALAAENLFLRKQLALFQEREIRQRRADDATRAAMVWLSKAFEWREALVIVKPGTLIRWHREGFRLFWKLKSRPGLPDPPSRLPVQLQEHRHRLPPVAGVTSRPILGGLHHDYALQLAA